MTFLYPLPDHLDIVTYTPTCTIFPLFLGARHVELCAIGVLDVKYYTGTAVCAQQW